MKTTKQISVTILSIAMLLSLGACSNMSAREKNAAIMATHPAASGGAEGALTGPDPGTTPVMHPLADAPPLPAETAAPELPLPAPKAE